MNEWKYQPSQVLVSPSNALYKVREVFATQSGTRYYKLTDGGGRPKTLEADVVEGDAWRPLKTTSEH